MSTHVCNGAVMKCSFGVAPSSLIVLPVNRVLTCGLPAATINDHVPLVNVPPFGMCQSPANPTVAAATAAASGVLTPMPCVPVLPAPWIPGSVTVLEGNIPVLNNTCQLTCMWGGLINISMPGQMTVLLDSGGAGGADVGTTADVEAGGVSLLDKIQLGLDAAGMIPVVQDFTDPVSAVASAARGDWAGAGLAIAGMIPIAGEAADAAKLAKDAEHVAEIAKTAEHATEAVKSAEHAAEAAKGAEHAAESIKASDLPAEANTTLEKIKQGGPFPYPGKDGSTFKNKGNPLPVKKDAQYYREYTVDTPGATNRGTRRIVQGKIGETYYTDDHYTTFKEVK